MFISQDNYKDLNYFSTPTGSEALIKLANMLYDHYAMQTVISTGEDINRAQGAAQLAVWLKLLPKGLQEYGRTSANN